MIPFRAKFREEDLSVLVAFLTGGVKARHERYLGGGLVGYLFYWLGEKSGNIDRRKDWRVGCGERV